MVYSLHLQHVRATVYVLLDVLAHPPPVSLTVNLASASDSQVLHVVDHKEVVGVIVRVHMPGHEVL